MPKCKTRNLYGPVTLNIQDGEILTEHCWKLSSESPLRSYLNLPYKMQKILMQFEKIGNNYKYPTRMKKKKIVTQPWVTAGSQMKFYFKKT